MKAVSKALGHANTKVTTEVYHHIDTEGTAAPLAGMSSKLLASVSKSSESTGGEEPKFNRWSREWELNPRPADYESAALPLSYLGLVACIQQLSLQLHLLQQGVLFW